MPSVLMQSKAAGMPRAQDLAGDLGQHSTDAVPAQVCLHCHIELRSSLVLVHVNLPLQPGHKFDASPHV